MLWYFIQRALLVVFLWALATPSQAAKLIHYGWDNPAIENLMAALPKLKASAFDGLTARPSAQTLLFASKTNGKSSFKTDLEKLRGIDHSALKNSYLAVLASTDEDFDWSNDAHWVLTIENFRQMAQLAKAGGLKGIVFDMEPYGKSPWNYGSQPASEKLEFAAFQKLIRKRGVEAMQALQTEYPGIEILGLYGMSAMGYAFEELQAGKSANEVLKSDGYGLWPSFMSGWIDAAAPSTRIIDGNEPSYYYTRRATFEKAFGFIKNDLTKFLDEDVRKRYSEKIILGHAVFVDGVMDIFKSPRFIGYYFADDQQRLQLLHDNILNGMETSESVVWVYAEQVKWWEAQPRKDIDDLVRSAKADAANGATLAPPSPALIKAETGLKTLISIGGKIRDANGKGIKPDSFKPPLAAVACSTWGDEGEYGCDFPRGSDVVVEPVIAGKAFEPKQLKLRKVMKSDWGVDWVVR